FLSSFELPERPPDQPKTTAADADAAVSRANTEGKDQAKGEGEAPLTASGAEGNTEQNTNASADTPNQQVPNPSQKPKAPMGGGNLNSKAISLPQPEVPGGEASGVVMVQVLVDEQGTVIDARPVSGPQHLQAAAVSAARLARFTPTLFMGEPVKVNGTLTYNFARSN